jgi:hypothetical protein
MVTCSCANTSNTGDGDLPIATKASAAKINSTYAAI